MRMIKPTASQKATGIIMAEIIAGYLFVGYTETGEVVINGGPAAVDEKGDWPVKFNERGLT